MRMRENVSFDSVAFVEMLENVTFDSVTFVEETLPINDGEFCCGSDGATFSS